MPSTDPEPIAEEMAALGEKPETIAAALRISVSGLPRDCRDALLHGHARRFCEAISLLSAKARAGSFQAIWKLFQMTGVTAAAGAPEHPRQPGNEAAGEMTVCRLMVVHTDAFRFVVPRSRGRIRAGLSMTMATEDDAV